MNYLFYLAFVRHLFDVSSVSNGNGGYPPLPLSVGYLRIFPAIAKSKR